MLGGGGAATTRPSTAWPLNYHCVHSLVARSKSVALLTTEKSPIAKVTVALCNVTQSKQNDGRDWLKFQMKTKPSQKYLRNARHKQVLTTGQTPTTWTRVRALSIQEYKKVNSAIDVNETEESTTEQWSFSLRIYLNALGVWKRTENEKLCSCQIDKSEVGR